MLSLNLFGHLPSAADDPNRAWRRSVERIASMRRINSATDDAAGLAMAERLATRIRGDSVAERGIEDGQSLAETADGTLGQVGDKLQRMRELSLQAGNGSLNDKDRASLDKEYHQLGAEVTRELSDARFNGKTILGDQAGHIELQAGADPRQTVSVDTKDLRQDPGVAQASAGHMSDAGSARQMTDQIDAALRAVGDLRASLGAAESRLAAVSSSLRHQVQIGSASYGGLTSVDLPAESSRLQSAQVAHYATIQSMNQFRQARRSAMLALLV